MTPPGLHGIRVLVASRDRAFSRTLRESLLTRGAEVDLFEPAGDVQAQPLDRTDVLVIETHGAMETTLALVDRARERSPLTEIVVISSGPPVESAVEALRAGVFTLLAYPVSDDEIAQAVADATERRRKNRRRIASLDARSGRG